MAEEHKKTEVRQLVRILDADISGDEKVLSSLRKITGVGFAMANAVCNTLDIDKQKKMGTFSEQELQKIEEVIRNPEKNGIPSWMLNRRKASETGEDTHLLTSDLKLAVDFDIKRMRKIKSYKGVRHSIGQPVRGQRTRSHFRHNKGKAPTAKKAAAPAAAGKK